MNIDVEGRMCMIRLGLQLVSELKRGVGRRKGGLMFVVTKRKEIIIKELKEQNNQKNKQGVVVCIKQEKEISFKEKRREKERNCFVINGNLLGQN